MQSFFRLQAPRCGLVLAAMLLFNAHHALAAHTLRVGRFAAIASISQAAKLAQDGDIIEIEAGEYAGDVAVWTQKQLSIRAVGGRVKLIAAGRSAEGKAIWVVRGGDITIQGIDFQGARVPDRNGAGIRLEAGNLIVRDCSFTDNENGILTAGGEATLEVENSEFGHNGAGDGRSHNIYVGPLRKFKVSGSYFHHARSGHLLKSRARENLIFYNRLSDEAGGHASYELEFPNGGISYVIGNLIEQSASTENTAMISVGAEGYSWPENELYLSSNTIVDDLPSAGTFLFAKPGDIKLVAVNNLLVGNGLVKAGKTVTAGMAYAWKIPGVSGDFENNYLVDRTQFVFPAGFDYRLKTTAPFASGAKFIVPAMANRQDLSPQFEYLFPVGKIILTVKPELPGAFQTGRKEQIR